MTRIKNIANVVLRSMLCDKPNSINVCHLNACSIFPKISYIREIVRDTNINVICVSETWLNATHSDYMVNIPGFNLVRHDRTRTDKSRGGGVAIYIRSDLGYALLSSSCVGDVVEYVFVQINAGQRSFLVGCTYNPPDSTTDFAALSCVLNNTIGKEIILTGDFNINTLMETEHILRFTELLSQSGSVIVNREPTHFKPNCVPSCLDLVICNCPDRVNMIDQLDIPISHHDMMVLSYDLHLSKPNESETYYRNYNSICEQALIADLRSLPWESIYLLTDPEEQLVLFNSLVLALFENHVPLKKTSRKPFIIRNDVLDAALQRRDIVHKRWRRLKNPVDWETFKTLRTEATRIETEMLQDHYSAQFSPRLSSSELWRNISRLGYKDMPTKRVVISSNALNENFVGSAPTSSSHTPLQDLSNDDTVNPVFSLSNVRVDNTLKALIGIKSNAIGHDNIPPRFIKLLLPHIVQYITHIYNTILTSSCFPSIWKIAKVIPIPKITNPKTAGDFRPISILSYLSKGLERLIADQVQNHLTCNRLMTIWQSGFRSNRSTLTPLLDVSETLRTSLDKGDMGILILLDFSKAFDTVNHDILLHKLATDFKFSTSARSLFRTYLQGRSQYVEQTSDVSLAIPTWRGVPQGSVLGPLLFSIYVNDLPSVVRNAKCHLYADDVQLVATGHILSGHTVISQINDDLNRVHSWALKNELLINPSKSTSMLFTRKNMRHTTWPNPKIHDVDIPFVSVAKNLGIWFDEDLKWDHHIQRVYRSVMGSVSRLRKIAWALPVCTRLRMAQSLIVPILSYGGPVFNSLKVASRAKLNSALNACTRFVFGLRMRDHISTYSKRILGCTLSQHYDIATCKLLFKIFKHQDPTFLSERLKAARSSRTLGIIPIRNRHAAYDGMFFVRGIKLWNRLPSEVKQSRSDSIFATRMKNLLSTADSELWTN